MNIHCIGCFAICAIFFLGCNNKKIAPLENSRFGIATNETIDLVKNAQAVRIFSISPWSEGEPQFRGHRVIAEVELSGATDIALAADEILSEVVFCERGKKWRIL
ncbi:MAG: hypothetical protein WCI02_18895, partial [Planctomycetota bacterium]